MIKWMDMTRGQLMDELIDLREQHNEALKEIARLQPFEAEFKRRQQAMGEDLYV